MTNPIKTAAEIVDLCTQRITALRKLAPPGTQITVDTKTYDLAALVAVFQANLDEAALITSIRSQLKAALANRVVTQATRHKVDRVLKVWVSNQFGADSTQAHEFGYPPLKMPVHTAASKVVAAAKSKATREARHTVGPKQKLVIHGAIIGSVVIPPKPAPVVVASSVQQPASHDAAPPHAALNGAP